MKHHRTLTAALAAAIMIGSAAGGVPAMAEDARAVSVLQFEKVAALAGEWRVQERPSLRIVFERTAGGSVIIERWMVGQRVHSLTVYHLDGERLIATHYCPQGNQPRLESRSASSGEIRFAFRDVTDLDPGESHTHALWFTPGADGTLQRSEVYRSDDGLQPAGHYTLSRLPEED